LENSLRVWWKSKNFLLALLFGVGCGALAFYAAGTGYFAVAREPLAGVQVKQPPSIAALGRIEPGSEIINLGADLSPDRLELLSVARGDVVKKGQVIGYLGAYSEQVAQRDMYLAQLEEARLRLKTEIELNRSRIESAETRQKQILEVSPLRIAAQEATIASLEAKLENDKDILASHSQLYSRGVASRRLQEDQHAMVLQGEANLKSARARLAELKQQFMIDKIDAEVQIKLARDQLERSKAEFPVASLESQVAWAEARIQRLRITAPIAGRILNIKVKPGEIVGSGPILTMGDTSKMRAVAEVYETDIGQVKLGQAAVVSSRALPGPMTGRVVRIGNMVFKNDVLNVDPAARADARVVEVWIELDDPAPAAQLTNLTVNVLIKSGDADPAVAQSSRP
jgi:HlyD family secretion protein